MFISLFYKRNVNLKYLLRKTDEPQSQQLHPTNNIKAVLRLHLPQLNAAASLCVVTDLHIVYIAPKPSGKLFGPLLSFAFRHRQMA